MADEAKVDVTEEIVPPIRSGLSQQLKQYQDKPVDKSVDVKSYDYTVFKDLGDEDYKKYESLKAKDEGSYYEILSHRNDMKKGQRIIADREKTINELKSKSIIPEDVQKLKEFVEGMKTNPVDTYKRYQKDFNLPEPTFLEKQISSGGGVEGRLQQWQDSDLIPSIEKKFKLEPGTFVYSSNEAYKVGTPSYEFRMQTEKQEKTLNSEYETVQTRQADILVKTKQQNDADLKFLQETYFPVSEFEVKDEKGVTNVEETTKKAQEAFTASLTKLDEIYTEIKNGEFDSSKNPFALKNIYRGIFFDELVQKAVQKATSDLTAQYNSKGLYLAGKEPPTDVNKVNGESVIIADSKRKFGVANRLRNQTLSQTTN